MKTICRMLKRDSKGFTLVELMVVLLIIGILVAIAVPIYTKSQDNAKETTCDANIRTLEGAAAQYRADYGTWPDNLSKLGGSYIREVPKCPFTKKEDGSHHTYTIDNTNGQVTCSHDNPSQDNPSQGSGNEE